MNENKLADIFGKPGEGVHAATIPHLNIAAFDTIGTVAIAAGISWYYDYSFIKTVFAAFAIGELAHIAFGVETRLIKRIREIQTPHDQQPS